MPLVITGIKRFVWDCVFILHNLVFWKIAATVMYFEIFAEKHKKYAAQEIKYFPFSSGNLIMTV